MQSLRTCMEEEDCRALVFFDDGLKYAFVKDTSTREENQPKQINPTWITVKQKMGEGRKSAWTPLGGDVPVQAGRVPGSLTLSTVGETTAYDVWEQGPFEKFDGVYACKYDVDLGDWTRTNYISDHYIRYAKKPKLNREGIMMVVQFVNSEDHERDCRGRLPILRYITVSETWELQDCLVEPGILPDDAPPNDKRFLIHMSSVGNTIAAGDKV